MFDRGRPKEPGPSSPDKKTTPSQGSHMNNEQFGLSHHLHCVSTALPVVLVPG
jgi:hypothetical protein